MQSLKGLDYLIISRTEGMMDNVYAQHPAQHQAHNSLPMDDFHIPLFLLCLVIDILLREGLSLPSHLLIYWFISFSQYGLNNSYLILLVIICNYNELFDALIVPDLTNRALFRLASVSFVMSPSLFEHFRTFWQDKEFWIKEN